MTDWFGLLTVIFTLGIFALMYKYSGWWWLAFLLWNWHANPWILPVTLVYVGGILYFAYKKSPWWFAALLVWNWVAVFAAMNL